MGEDTRSSRDRHSGSSSAGTSANGCGKGAGSLGWLGPESRLPTRDRSSTGHSPIFQMPPGTYPDAADGGMMGASTGQTVSMQGYAQGDGGGGDMHELSSTSPGDGLSSRPTPNSSVASEQRQTLAPPGQTGPGHMRSAAGSYDAGPASPSHGIGGKSGGAGRMGQTAGGYYASEYPSQPSMSSTGLSGGGGSLGGMMPAPSSDGYTMSAGWSLPAQTAMTPVSEGVLHTIMQMGPMETMDLGWDSNP